MDIADISVEYIDTHFRAPLETVRANLASIQDELEEVVDYSRKYLMKLSKAFGTNSIVLRILRNGPMFWYLSSSCTVYVLLTVRLREYFLR